MTENDFTTLLAGRAAQVEKKLDELLGPGVLAGEIRRPERLTAAMRYASLGGGKRLRPFLVIECARALGATGEGVTRAACAVELVHCYSLVHDDLPAMDDDDLRRGRPTVHKAFDEALAILAGDSLLTYAFDVATDPLTHPDAAVRAQLTLGLARAAGFGGMAGGQALDLEAETAPRPLSRAAIEELQAMKTGALLAFAVEAGAILGGADASVLAALRGYGRALGAAFQIADDLLDATGDESAVGKRTGKDQERGKATLVSALGIEGARAACESLVGQALERLGDARLGSRGGVLEQTVRFVAARRS